MTPLRDARQPELHHPLSRGVRADVDPGCAEGGIIRIVGIIASMVIRIMGSNEKERRRLGCGVLH